MNFLASLNSSEEIARTMDAVTRSGIRVKKRMLDMERGLRRSRGGLREVEERPVFRVEGQQDRASS